MCETCGCGKPGGFVIHGPENVHNHMDDHSHVHHGSTDHDHSGIHDHDHTYDHGDSRRKVIGLNADILEPNNITAAMNRRFLEGRKVTSLNIVSSPGSGKTTILEKTIISLKPSLLSYVIEGDQQTEIDAERIRKTGAPVVQINTGSGCHLDARMIEAALRKLDVASDSVLFIENVGNLVCPAMFDLGEFRRVLVMSVTEGADKPLKYPNMFETSHLCIINKSDLLPYVDFNPDDFIHNALAINPSMEFILMSAATGEGMKKWRDWVTEQALKFINQ